MLKYPNWSPGPDKLLWIAGRATVCSHSLIMSALQQTAQPSQLEPLLEQVAANQNLQNLLASLPDRTRRSVMVPFGAVAFFPGQLVHTNECLVNMGEVTYRLKSFCYRGAHTWTFAFI